MKKSSPFLRALRPTFTFLGVFLVLAYMLGDKSPFVTIAIGAPWSFLVTSYSKSTLLFPFDLGAWINALIVYALSVWFYSRK